MVNPDLIDPSRKLVLSRLAHELRQSSLSKQDDMEGWKVARLLRDAVTSGDADEAERRWMLLTNSQIIPI